MFTKIIIHMLSVLIIADLVWIIVISSVWTHDQISDKNAFWNGLEGMQTFVVIMAYLEFILKGLAVFYLVSDFRAKYPNDLSKNNLYYII
jgi:hypothetical protein